MACVVCCAVLLLQEKAKRTADRKQSRLCFDTEPPPRKSNPVWVHLNLRQHLRCIGCFHGHINRTALLWMDLRHVPQLFSLSSCCGNHGRVPYRRLCTMAQVPLNLRKFLPETNIARNSNLGLSRGLAEGSNNSLYNNGNYLILSTRLRSSSDTVWGAHSVFLLLIRLPEKHTAGNQGTTIGNLR